MINSEHPTGVEIDMNCLHALFFVCKASLLESTWHLHPFGVEIDMNCYMQKHCLSDLLVK